MLLDLLKGFTVLLQIKQYKITGKLEAIKSSNFKSLADISFKFIEKRKNITVRLVTYDN